MPRNQNISFFQGELHGLKYQMLSGDLLISYQYASVYPYQLQQSLSTELDKRLLNGWSWILIDRYRLVFFLLRKSSIWKWIGFSIIFDTSCKREIRRELLGSVLAPFLNIVFNLPILLSSVKVDSFIDKCIIFPKGRNILRFLVTCKRINLPGNLQGYFFVIHCFSWWKPFRSSHLKVFCNKVFLKIYGKKPVSVVCNLI